MTNVSSRSCHLLTVLFSRLCLPGSENGPPLQVCVNNGMIAAAEVKKTTQMLFNIHYGFEVLYFHIRDDDHRKQTSVASNAS